jgi:hypothetical protein
MVCGSYDAIAIAELQSSIDFSHAKPVPARANAMAGFFFSL